MDSSQNNGSLILNQVRAYYQQKLTEHGPTIHGVDWSNEDRQRLVFEQLTKICCSPRSGARDTDFTVLDYGCGLGSLLSYLTNNGWICKRYIGFDMLPDMVSAARQLNGSDIAEFTDQTSSLCPADYVIGSGVISVKADADFSAWQDHVLKLLERMWSLAVKGLAFNSLTKYSDHPKMQDRLYYADPCFLFDFCKTHLSRNVALLHDYGLYEFTVLVRRDESIV
jgi:SAM-dependent methyltransferase